MTDAVLTQWMASEETDRRASRVFVHVACIVTLVLQRFGLIIGDGALFLSLPAYALLLGWAGISGIATIQPRATASYLLFAVWALIVTIGALAMPDMRFGLSLSSLGALLLTYSLAVIRPSERFDREAVFDIFLFYIRLCAALGIAQFVLQFVGLRVFSFAPNMPVLAPFSVEWVFNFNPILHYGSSIMRSNGFFLLEPSIWSQVLALAVVTDYFILGRTRWLPLYLVAYIVTFSGSGALSLIVSMPFFAALSARHFARIIALLMLAIIGLCIASAAFPAEVGSMLARTQELNYSGSSGYARYIGPFLPIGEFADEARFLFGYGPGATERYIHHMADTGNSIAKLLIDYGVIGLLLFTTMLTRLLWRPDVAMLSILSIVTFFLGGGYLVFAPILVLMFLLCGWGSAGPSAENLEDQRP
jgi:hypothetical protein